MANNNLSPALSPLEPLLSDESITEIMVDAPGRVIVERKGKLVDAGIKFDSPEALRAAMDAALALGGVSFKPGQTVADARLADGSRILGVLPPTAVSGPYLVIRKVWKTTLTMDKVIEFGALTREALALLQSAIRARLNILVAGGAGSGKTTLMSLLTDEIPAEERVIAAEAFFELHLRHPRAINLSSDSSPDLSYVDVISTAAKMRPDRLIFGELRGAEVMRILDIVSVGHDGSMMTMHATSPEDALTRLEAMCLTANLGLGLGEIRNLIASTLQLIVHIQRLPDGRRRIMRITELRGLEHDRFVLQPLMRYNPAEDKLEATGARSSWESN